jgi:hypothetical protein
MPTILQNALDQQIARLLGLFPISHLRKTFTDVGAKLTKEAFCLEVAKKRQYAQIVNFIDAHFSCTKQHVYMLQLAEDAEGLPTKIKDGQRVKHTASRALYITRLERGVFLADPIAKTTIEFLWPVVIELHKKTAVVRFVTLEKNISAYFTRKAWPAERGLEEKDVVADLAGDFIAGPCDINMGIKALWDEDFVDGYSARYKTAIATTSQDMHDQKGIKKTSKTLYEEIIKAPLAHTIFTVDKTKKMSVEVFTADPGKGTISFTRYSDNLGDTDRVIREILQKN